MKQLQIVKKLMVIMIAGLLVSGLTVFPVNSELNFLLDVLPGNSEMHGVITKVLNDYNKAENDSPQLLYGLDWLGFAHIVLAILFIGPYRDPVKNIWVIEFGLISSLLIFPLAFIAGPIRGIPVTWRLIDCSFGVVAGILLWIAYRNTKQIISSKIKI